MHELFYGPEPARTHIYEYSKSVEVGVVKEQNYPKDKKGNHGDLHLKVDMCCEACVKKVRRVLIELNGPVKAVIDLDAKQTFCEAELRDLDVWIDVPEPGEEDEEGGYEEGQEDEEAHEDDGDEEGADVD